MEPLGNRGQWQPAAGAGGEGRAADLQAVRRLAEGDGEALGGLYDRHARAMFSLICRILQDEAEAEEVLQDVFSQVWARAATYDARRGPVAAGLLTIARSRAIDRLRARRARPDMRQAIDDRTISEVADPGIDQETTVLTAEQIARLQQALTRLPSAQRIAIELAYYDGLTQSEIAAELDQPRGTVKTRIRLGLLKLRGELAALGRRS